MSERSRSTLAVSAVVLLAVSFASVLVSALITAFVGISWGSPRIGSALLAADSCALWCLIPAWLLRRAGPGVSYRRTAVVVTWLAAALLLVDVGLYSCLSFFSSYD